MIRNSLIALVAATAITAAIFTLSAAAEDTVVIDSVCVKSAVDRKDVDGGAVEETIYYVEVYGRSYLPSYDGNFAPGEASYQAAISSKTVPAGLIGLVNSAKTEAKKGRARIKKTPKEFCFHDSGASDLGFEWVDSAGSIKLRVPKTILSDSMKSNLVSIWLAGRTKAITDAPVDPDDE